MPLVSEVHHAPVGKMQVVLRPTNRALQVTVRRAQRARQQARKVKLPAVKAATTKAERMLKNFGTLDGVEKWTQAVEAGLRKADKPLALDLRSKVRAELSLGHTADHAGLLVAMQLDQESAKRLALKPCIGCKNSGSSECQVCGGNPPESWDRLHVTLAYVGAPEAGWPEGTLDRTVKVISEVVADQEELTGRIGGVGRFVASETSDDLDVLIALVDVRGLGKLREDVVEALRAADLEPSTVHGFVPHVSVQYVPPAARKALPRVPDVDLVFAGVTVYLGGSERFVLFPG